jgi:hypothetical protein
MPFLFLRLDRKTHTVNNLAFFSSSLAIGSPLSAIPLLLTKINTFHTKHGPFDACVIIGDLFKEGSDGSEIDGVKCKLAALRPEGDR